MNIYHSTQEWDKLNQSLSDIFDIDYQPLDAPESLVCESISYIGFGGFKHTEETKKLISDKLKGLSKSDEFKNKLSIYQTGRKHTEETKTKISISRKAAGITLSAEHKAKLIASQKPLSDEHKAKLREKALIREDAKRRCRQTTQS